jgi:hypothetical protein
MGLDLISFLMDSIGLEKRPVSFEQMVAFGGTPHPPLNDFDFSVPIKKALEKKGQEQPK